METWFLEALSFASDFVRVRVRGTCSRHSSDAEAPGSRTRSTGRVTCLTTINDQPCCSERRGCLAGNQGGVAGEAAAMIGRI